MIIHHVCQSEPARMQQHREMVEKVRAFGAKFFVVAGGARKRRLYALFTDFLRNALDATREQFCRAAFFRRSRGALCERTLQRSPSTDPGRRCRAKAAHFA
jgi:hypothetical protein